MKLNQLCSLISHMVTSNHIMILDFHIVLVLLSLSQLAAGQTVNGSQIQDIHLVDHDGTVSGSQGRVEIKHNGKWGTVCDNGWYTAEARVACRMLGFEDALCAVQNSYFGRANYSTPTWMDNVNCGGYESALDLCHSFSGWEVHVNQHGQCDDAGVICLNESSMKEVSVPRNIRLITSSTLSLTIGWTAPACPSWATYRRFTIRYEAEGGYVQTQAYSNSSYISHTGVEMSYTLISLTKDTRYSVQIRVDARNSACEDSLTYGNYSDPVSFQTNATRRESNIRVRLVSPSPGLLYLGRVEVLYDNQWGTVCDDSFGTTEANVICRMLNFTRGAMCSVNLARFGQGQGPIWLDNVDCQPEDEVLEDCDHSPWGNTSCSHSKDVGVICRSSAYDVSSAVQNLVVLSIGPTSITLGWSLYTFPFAQRDTGFHLQYTDHFGRTKTSSTYSYFASQTTQYTLSGLQFGEEYSISIRASFQYSAAGCYRYRDYNIYGGYSNTVTATTMETAPTAPPQDFYVTLINMTAIEATWELPPAGFSGGLILGYKLFVQSINGGTELMIDIPDNTTEVYTVEELQPATSYRLSVLAYTSVGDGPRSIQLTVLTLGFDPLITQFGYYGNDQTRITRYLQSYSYYNYNSSYLHGKVHIHCASSNFTSAPPDWFFANGSAIGVRDSNFQVGYFPWNGTAVLKIADYRLLRYCDGGIFTCRVVDSDSGQSEEKSFTLTVDTTPPSLDQPFLIKVQSTSITIGWSVTCDGGHAVNNFNILYRQYYNSGYYKYTDIRNIDPAQRSYRIIDLQPDTNYSFSIQIVTWRAQSSSYSPYISATTLPPAPTPPHDVTARLVAPLKVEVRWRPPAMTNGNISQYYVYAIADELQSEPLSNTPQVIRRAFPGNARAGNITIMIHSVSYQFRVSAAVSFDQTYNEGDLSPVSANTSLFVPKPGAQSADITEVVPVTAGISRREVGGITVGVAIGVLLAVM